MSDTHDFEFEAPDGQNKKSMDFVDFIAERIIATQMDLLRLLNNGGVNGGVNLEVLIFETIQNSPGINAPALQIK